MYMSTFARLMPSMILSNAASTPVEGAVAVVVLRRVDVRGEGEASGFADLVAVFGVACGFASTVRVRLDGAVVLLFCAKLTIALAKIINAMTRHLFMSSSSEVMCLNREQRPDQEALSVYDSV